MELNGKVQITIEGDDKDNNYCSRECLYFIKDGCCYLQLLAVVIIVIMNV